MTYQKSIAYEAFAELITRAGKKDLLLWVIYDHPSDFPNDFVMRAHSALTKSMEFSGALEPYYAGTLEQLRELAMDLGLVRLSRDQNDEPHIVEVWI